MPKALGSIPTTHTDAKAGVRDSCAVKIKGAEPGWREVHEDRTPKAEIIRKWHPKSEQNRDS